MTSYLPHDLQSLLPKPAPRVAEVPAVGAKAPSLPGINFTECSHLVAFVRHCGCPFAEKEVRSLAKALQRKPNDVRIVIVAHSKQDVVDDWFERIGKPHFTDLSRVKVIADPDYKYYAAFGIGKLGWGGLFNLDMLKNVRELATSEGIKNTVTGEGSNRWLNSGGFAVDKSGTVRWNKVAKDASDTCDYEAALQTVIDGHDAGKL